MLNHQTEQKTEVNEVLVEAVAGARNEIFCAIPGGIEGSAVGELLPGKLRALRRGVRMRSLFQHPARVNSATREVIARLQNAGCELRTCEEIPEPVFVIDQDVAVILGVGDGVAVREPAMVGFLHGSLERSWAGAVPYDEGSLPGYGPAGKEVKQAIVRLLAAGAKDELIARRLGLSLRSCRRHISEILDGLQATSRFQAGAMASRCGLLDDWQGRA